MALPAVVSDGPAPSGPARRRPALSSPLGERVRPLVLARTELLPVAAPFAELLGTPGLRRGSTVAVVADGARGATSVGLGLVAKASGAGAWCAVVGMEDLGLVATSELGILLERLVLVPRPGRRAASVTACLLEGFDIVLVGGSAWTPAEQRRLFARARERRAVLVLLAGSRAERGGGRRPDGVDVCLAVCGGAFEGLGRGWGRLQTHAVDVVATRRAASPRTVGARLLLPAGGGGSAPTPVTAEGVG